MQLTSDGLVNGVINLHGRTAGNEEWKMESVKFSMGK